MYIRLDILGEEKNIPFDAEDIIFETYGEEIEMIKYIVSELENDLIQLHNDNAKLRATVNLLKAKNEMEAKNDRQKQS